MGELEANIAATVTAVLGIDGEAATSIAAYLTSHTVGVRNLDELKFVTTEDLAQHLDPIPARRLVAHWKAEIGR